MKSSIRPNIKIKRLEDEIGVTAICGAFTFIDYYLDEGKSHEEILRSLRNIVQGRIFKRKKQENRKFIPKLGSFKEITLSVYNIP